MFIQLKFLTRILLIGLLLVLSIVTLSIAQDELPDVNALQLPNLDQNPQRPGQDILTLPVPEGNEQNQTTTGPANPFLPSQQPEAPIQPQQNQPVIQWKQLDLSQTFGFDPLITGTVKYPANWAINIDTWNKRIVFSEDQSGLTAFTAFLPVQGTLQDAQAYAQQISGWIQSSIPDLKIVNQDYRTDPSSSQTGMNLTKGRVILQGTYQGRVFVFQLQTTVLYIPVTNFSYLSALLCQAPQDVFQEKLQTYFNPMLIAFENLGK